MNKLIVLVSFILISTANFAQNFKQNEIKAFIDFDNGNYNAVIDSIDDIIKYNPKTEFYMLKAEALMKLKDYNNALQVCEKINRMKPAAASLLEFRIFLELRNEKDAYQALETNLTSYNKIALYDLMNSDKYAELYSMNLDQKILAENKYSQTEKQIYQAQRLIEKKAYSQALFLLSEIISRKWETPEAHYLKSVVLFEGKDFNASKQSINTALILKKSEPAYVLQRIQVLMELKEYEKALSDVNRLIRLDAYQIDYFILKADLLYKAGYLEEAKKLTENILILKDNNPDVLYIASKAAYDNEEFLESLKLINKAFEIKSNKEYFELRGDIYLATKTYQYAVEDYSMFLDINPRDGDIYAKKGFARYRLGDQKGACSDWEKAKRYGSYQAIQYLEKYCN